MSESIIDVAAVLYPKDGSAPDLRFTLRQGEAVGLCFPVHGWRPAPIMRQFVDAVQLIDEDGRKVKLGASVGHYLWALCTAGDDIGETMERLSQQVGQRGWTLDSVFSLIMPESYVGLPFMDVDNEEKEWAKRRTAEAALREDILPVIIQRQTGVVNTYKGHWPRINSRLIGEVFERHIVGDGKFRVDAKRCTSCGLCATLCPVNDISGGKGQQPRWLHTGRCMSCFACYHHCPVRAIEYGSRTKGKGQYYLH